MATRKRYSADFKAKLVIEALKEQRTVQEIAADHDLNPNLLFKWRREFLEHPERVFDERKRAGEVQRQNSCLQKKWKREKRAWRSSMTCISICPHQARAKWRKNVRSRAIRPLATRQNV